MRKKRPALKAAPPMAPRRGLAGKPLARLGGLKRNPFGKEAPMAEKAARKKRIESADV